MNKVNPMFEQTTHYRIEIQGRVNGDWLQSFNNSAEIIVDETRQMENISVLDVHIDQSGIVGLVRRLHGLGMTILHLQIIPDGGKAA
jgi:hypothetical protein